MENDNSMTPGSNQLAQHEELKQQLKNINEKLIEYKKMIAQDQKLLESTKDQLKESSNALEEHESRVALLRQQLERAQRLKAVQKDLVNKLQIQKSSLSKRLFKRQSDARELEESLLRARALLVARKAQKISLGSIGDRKPGDVLPRSTNPGDNAGNGGQNSTQQNTTSVGETQERLSGLSQSFKESTLATKKVAISDQHKVNRAPVETSKSSGSASSLTTRKLTDEKLALERIRLKKLEEELSKKLRQSSARQTLTRDSAGSLRKGQKLEVERASSDSELLVKKTCPRVLTSPVELTETNLDDRAVKVSTGGTADSLDLPWNILKNVDALEKIKKIQADKESSGPSFPDLDISMALPAQFISTQCIWLSVKSSSVSQQFDAIAGCVSALATPTVTRVPVDGEQGTYSVSGPYRSPLVYYRSYRFSPYFRTKKGLPLDSLTFSHLIDPHLPFCSFALHGICSDPECTRQHFNDIVPKSDEILEDLAAYFAPSYNKASGKEDLGKAVKTSVAAITKQYGGKVSQADLRVLFVNQLRKQKASRVYNVVLQRRPWRPCSRVDRNPGTAPEDENDGETILTESTFSWKAWKRKIQTEINTRSGRDEECQEVRYFSENYDSIKTLEKAAQENPLDETLWIRLAMVYMGSNGKKRENSGSNNYNNNNNNNNNGNDNNSNNTDKALNVLAQALEINRHSEKLWLKYLELFRDRGTTQELYEVCEEAIELASSYDVWWMYLEIASDYERKLNICLRLIEYLQTTDYESYIKSHRLLEAFLYLVQLDRYCGFNSVASDRFQTVLRLQDNKDTREKNESFASFVNHLVCEDLCLLWLSYIHLVEFSNLPRHLFDPRCDGPSRIVCKDNFVFSWKPDGGTTYAASRLLKLFHRALKDCAAVSKSSDKITSSLPLYQNLIAFERACGKTETAIRNYQRLLKASPNDIELWLCLAALHQLGGHEASVAQVYKNALGKCTGHAKVVYSATKYFLEKGDLKECYDCLACCVYSKFVLEASSPGPRTRAKSLEKPKLIQPDPLLLYQKLLFQSLPPDNQIPPFKSGLDPAKLGSETTYLWLCYCVYIELFSCFEDDQRHKTAQAAYESAIHSTPERKEAKILWTDYLHFMLRQLEKKQCSTEEVNDIFHRCFVTVPAITPLPYVVSKSWPNYRFHNQVMALYRKCLGDSFSSTVYDKYLELFPDNCTMAIQAIEYLFKSNEINKSKKILSSVMLKTPYNILLWKIAISIELKERNIDQARQLYEHATEILPLAATLWKDFVLFHIAHDRRNEENMQSVKKVISKAKESGINLEEFVKTLLSK